MAAVQSTYSETIPALRAGMVVNGETSNRLSRTIEDASGIGFGKAAFRGVGDHGITGTPASGVGNFMGITIEHLALGILAGQTPDTYPQYANVPLMEMGVIGVITSVNVNDGEQVYVTSAGVFTNSSSGNTILTGWFFDATALAGAAVPIARR